MPSPTPIQTAWTQTVVATRSPAGKVFLLLTLRKAACEACRFGVRFDTTWAARCGETVRITWCRSCFNADCEPAELDRRLRPVLRRMAARLDAEPGVRAWEGARPAVEDLERRGLV
jgi:hypothetical protein